MATVTLKNIPNDIYLRLKKTAQRVEDALVSARRLRGRIGGLPLSLEEIAEARRLGRP